MMLNKRSETVNTCRHSKKFTLKHIRLDGSLLVSVFRFITFAIFCLFRFDNLSFTIISICLFPLLRHYDSHTNFIVLSCTDEIAVRRRTSRKDYFSVSFPLI